MWRLRQRSSHGVGIFANKNTRAKKRYLSFSNNKLNMFFSLEDQDVFTEREMKLVQFFFLALSFCVCFSSFLFWSSSSSSSSSFQKKQKALASPHNNDTTTNTTEEEQQQKKKKSNRSNHHQNQNARRATIGRVLRRTRERARREAIERDRSSSGGEHREEQFRTRWVGQGILVKILFSNREKVNVGIAMDRFLSLSLSLCALRRARRLAEVLYLCIKLTSSFLF